MSDVLIIDDANEICSEVSSFLIGQGISTATATDGADGFSKIKSDKGIKLVICDVNMPVMDGLTMVEKVRGELGNTSLPIIMLTTESSSQMRARGQAAGIKGWIVKPFNGPASINAIRSLIK